MDLAYVACPVLDVNGQAGTGPIYLEAKVGDAAILDASHSRDPDGQAIQYHWFHYPEAGSMEASLAIVSIIGDRLRSKRAAG